LYILRPAIYMKFS